MLVVDGSVLLAWAVETPVSAAAAALLEEEVALAAPQAALSEAVEGARRLMRLGHVAAEDVQRLAALLPPLLDVLAADAPLLAQATEVAAAHALPVAAALALVLARARGAALATADARLAEAARQVLGAERVRPLSA